MKNLFEEYFIDKDIDWHDYEIGEYHVTGIGISYPDLPSSEHYGPCLRKTYWEYNDPLPDSIDSEGEFKMGDLLHEEIQKIRKSNKPSIVPEFPLLLPLERKGEVIWVMGSVDLLEFNRKEKKITMLVSDIKTASPYTFPSSKYQFNPTYITQIYIYTYILTEKVFKESYVEKPEKMEILYIKKASPALQVGKQTKIYDEKEAEKIYKRFKERCWFLHKCLKKEQVPLPEPHRWCKYCKYYDRCKDDLIYDKEERCYERK